MGKRKKCAKENGNMSIQDKYIDYIREKLDTRTLLEQLAEESAELSQAALKLIRAKKMSNNTTPIDSVVAVEMLAEEWTDVLMVLYALDIFDLGQALEYVPRCSKWKRWAERLGYKEQEQRNE